MNTAMNRYWSPLRYPGGKAKISNYLKLLMIENDLIGREYVEPFAGGASVALTLLFEEYADRVHINDINPGVYAFWNAALNATEDLCKLIELTPVTVNEWKRQRSALRTGEADQLHLGFATFFLNRTNRSGIIRRGGVIGGLGQTGRWKLDARYNKADLIHRIRKIGRYRSRIRLTCTDGEKFLRAWANPAEQPALLYLDPPYFVKGSELYDNFYTHADHVAIARAVRTLRHPWVVSYDAAPDILSLYGGFGSIRYSLAYSANKAALGSEVMFFAPGLTPPDRSPSGVPTDAVVNAKASVYK